MAYWVINGPKNPAMIAERLHNDQPLWLHRMWWEMAFLGIFTLWGAFICIDLVHGILANPPLNSLLHDWDTFSQNIFGFIIPWLVLLVMAIFLPLLWGYILLTSVQFTDDAIIRRKATGQKVRIPYDQIMATSLVVTRCFNAHPMAWILMGWRAIWGTYACMKWNEDGTDQFWWEFIYYDNNAMVAGLIAAEVRRRLDLKKPVMLDPQLESNFRAIEEMQLQQGYNVDFRITVPIGDVAKHPGYLMRQVPIAATAWERENENVELPGVPQPPGWQ
jgi:hypothetical protein